MKSIVTVKRALTRGERREQKRQKRIHGMKVDGRSIFVIQDVIQKKAKKSSKGPVAQSGEHFPCKEEDVGSTPSRSIMPKGRQTKKQSKSLVCEICRRRIPPAELGGAAGGGDVSKPICTSCELDKYAY